MTDPERMCSRPATRRADDRRPSPLDELAAAPAAAFCRRNDMKKKQPPLLQAEFRHDPPYPDRYLIRDAENTPLIRVCKENFERFLGRKPRRGETVWFRIVEAKRGKQR